MPSQTVSPSNAFVTGTLSMCLDATPVLLPNHVLQFPDVTHNAASTNSTTPPEIPLDCYRQRRSAKRPPDIQGYPSVINLNQKNCRTEHDLRSTLERHLFGGRHACHKLAHLNYRARGTAILTAVLLSTILLSIVGWGIFLYRVLVVMARLLDTDRRQTAVLSVDYNTAIDLTWHSHSTGVPFLGVP